MFKIAYFDNSGSDEKRLGWQISLTKRLGPVDLIPLESVHAQGCEYALVWHPPHGQLARLKNLKLIISMGQGVDHLFADKALPEWPYIVRLVDPDMSHALSQWAILAVLDHLRDGPFYRQAAESRQFRAIDQKQTKGLKLGVYGMGAIGKVIAERLHMLGFDVHGWSRGLRDFGPDITAHHGLAGCDEMLQSCMVHICVLPLTAETRHIYTARAFCLMPKGSYFINGGRGQQVVETDLLDAIQSGHLAGACLDVFETEPLPNTHPFWAERAITIWPHVAAQTNPDTSADQVATALQAVKKGNSPAHQVDRDKGY